MFDNAITKKNTGIYGGLILSGNTSAGTFGCRCTKTPVSIIMMIVKKEMVVKKVYNFFEILFPLIKQKNSVTPTAISPIIPIENDICPKPLLAICTVYQPLNGFTNLRMPNINIAIAKNQVVIFVYFIF